MNDIRLISIYSKDFREDYFLLNYFANFIFSGGEILNIDTIYNNLRNCIKTYVLFNRNFIIGTITLKFPNEDYKENILGELKDEYDYELGYLVINNFYRNKGFGKILFNICHNDFYETKKYRFYLTCRQNNSAMNKIIKNYNNKYYLYNVIQSNNNLLNVYLTNYYE